MRSIIAFVALLGLAAAAPQTFIGQNPIAGFGGALFPSSESSASSGALFPNLPPEVSIQYGDGTTLSLGNDAIVQIHLNIDSDQPLSQLVEVIHNQASATWPAVGVTGVDRPVPIEGIAGVDRPLPQEIAAVVDRPVPGGAGETITGVDRPTPEEVAGVDRPIPVEVGETVEGIDRPIPGVDVEQIISGIDRPTPDASVSSVDRPVPQVHDVNGVSSVSLPISGTVDVPLTLFTAAAALAQE